MSCYRIVNLDRQGGPVAGLAEPHDQAVVVDTTVFEEEPETGRHQYRRVFRGTLAECRIWISDSEAGHAGK